MIIVKLLGGMGNQMFQYACGRALSLKYGVPLKLNTEAYLLDKTRKSIKKHFAVREYNLGEFNIAAEIAKPNEIPFAHRMYDNGKLMLIVDAIRRRIFFHKGKELTYRFDPKIPLLGPNTYLEGDWQSPKYFAGYEDVIRKDFTLKKPLSSKMEKLYAEIESKNSVCIHIRRGDYVGNNTYSVVSMDYYNEGLSHIEQKGEIDCIYVFDRDDIDWCKKNIHFNYPTVFVENDLSLAEHIVLMGASKHFIIANSSFSWWAAWLAPYENKTVIAPKKWFANDALDTKDLIPESWIRI